MASFCLFQASVARRRNSGSSKVSLYVLQARNPSPCAFGSTLRIRSDRNRLRAVATVLGLRAPEYRMMPRYEIVTVRVCESANSSRAGRIECCLGVRFDQIPERISAPRIELLTPTRKTSGQRCDCWMCLPFGAGGMSQRDAIQRTALEKSTSSTLITKSIGDRARSSHTKHFATFLRSWSPTDGVRSPF